MTKFYDFKEGQLRLFSEEEFSSLAKSIEEKDFRIAFQPYAGKISEIIHSAHEEVIRETIQYPPQNNKIKAQLLNDRIQRMLKEQLPEFVVKDGYEIICFKVNESFLCTFKKSERNKLPSFSETKRAIERFSQFRRENSDIDIPYVVIVYRLSPDFQKLDDIWAVKPKINRKLKKLEKEWFISFEEMVSNKQSSIQSNVDHFEEEKYTGLPELNKKTG